MKSPRNSGIDSERPMLKQKNIKVWLKNILDWRYLVSQHRIRSFKQKHEGQRCFIIGNGPSLAKTDLSLLNNEFTFGMNRIYLLFDELGFTTSYYVSVNSLVIEQFADDIANLSVPKFLSWAARDKIDFTANMMFLRYSHFPAFTSDIQQRLWQGATVTYVAMQIAYYMGFRQVILIGVDHSFVSKGQPHKTIVSNGDDPNHFHPDYFGKGTKWQLPDLETSELAYRIAHYQYRQTGREVLDATIDGQLQVFPKVDYTSLFNQKKY